MNMYKALFKRYYFVELLVECDFFICFFALIGK